MTTEVELLITVKLQGDIGIDAKAAALHLAEVLSEHEYKYSNACCDGILPLTNGSAEFVNVESFTVDCDGNVVTVAGYHCSEVIPNWQGE